MEGRCGGTRQLNRVGWPPAQRPNPGVPSVAPHGESCSFIRNAILTGQLVKRGHLGFGRELNRNDPA